MMKKIFWFMVVLFLFLAVQQVSAYTQLNKSTQIVTCFSTSNFSPSNCTNVYNNNYNGGHETGAWLSNSVSQANLTINFTSGIILAQLNYTGLFPSTEVPQNFTIIDEISKNVLLSLNASQYNDPTLFNITNLINTTSITFIFTNSSDPDQRFRVNELDFWLQDTLNNVFTSSLDYPSNGLTFIKNHNITFNATSSATGNYNVTNATLYIWNSTGIINNSVLNFGGQSTLNTSSFLVGNINVADGYTWNVLTCGTNSSATLCNFATQNNSFNINSFVLLGQTFDYNVSETDYRNFTANITLDSSTTFISAVLVYNGTSYPLQQNEISVNNLVYSFRKSIDIESTPTNTTKNFFWKFVFRNGIFTTQQTDPQFQNVASTNITDRATNSATINYTIYDEENLQPLNATFASSFSWYLGSGTIVENYSYLMPSNNNFRFYSVPRERNLITSQKISLTNITTGSAYPLSNISHSNRYFDFNKDYLNNITTERNLYVLPSGNGTVVTIHTTDSGFADLPNIFVKVERYYQSDGKYRMVENKRTDNYGAANVLLVQNNIKYKFSFYDSNNNLLKQVVDDYVSCQTTPCILPFVINDNNQGLNYYNQSNLVQSNLTFNNNTNTFVFTWVDNTGQDATYRLLITEYLFNGSIVVYNSSAGGVTGILSYTAGNFKASYTAQTFRLVNGIENQLTDVLSATIGDVSKTFGFEGLFWSAILMLTMILIGIYSPVVGVVLYLVSFILLGVLNIIYINPAIAIAEIVLGVLFIWAFRS